MYAQARQSFQTWNEVNPHFCSSGKAKNVYLDPVPDFFPPRLKVSALEGKARHQSVTRSDKILPDLSIQAGRVCVFDWKN